MKKGRIIITAVMLVLLTLAWLVQGSSLVKNMGEYRTCINEAETYIEQGLYQKALQAYDEALTMKDTENLREQWIDCYKAAYEDNVTSKDDYSKALSVMCDMYPKNARYWEAQISLSLQNSEYKNARNYMDKAKKAGATSEALSQCDDIITYSYSENNRVYTQVLQSPEGYFTLYDDRNWGVTDPAGEWIFESVYKYASPVGASGISILATSKDERFVNFNNVVQAISAVSITEARAPSEVLTPIRIGNAWQYYNIETNTVAPEKYEDASSFSDGIAAVKKGNKWKLIDQKGTGVGKASFDDIKLFDNGDYLYKGVMVASVNGKYGFYDAKGNSLNAFCCDDMDRYFGDAIAFKDQSGKWGFVDKDGNIVIKAQYEKARSFSGGVAAVYSEDKWGFIKNDGKIVIKCEFLDVGYFTPDGICFVSKLDKCFYKLEFRFK